MELSKQGITKQLLSDDYEIVDNDLVYFELELEMWLVVHYDATIVSDYDGNADPDTYEMKITNVYIEDADRFIRPLLSNKEYSTLEFSGKLYEEIRDKYID